MTRSDARPPIVCSLDVAALGNREEEFRGLFARALRRVERPDGRSAQLVLDVACEAEARDLFTRERRCCAFFNFDVAVVNESVVIEVRVPADRVGTRVPPRPGATIAGRGRDVSGRFVAVSSPPGRLSTWRGCGSGAPWQSRARCRADATALPMFQQYFLDLGLPRDEIDSGTRRD